MSDCKPKSSLSRPKLLATDLDGTLIPLNNAADARAALAELTAVLAELSIPLVFVTGRHLESIRNAAKEADLPRPHWIIGDVGTSLYQETGGDYRLSHGFHRRLSELTGNVPASTLADMLTEEPGLRLQEAEKQGAFKLSFYADADECEQLGARLLQWLQERSLPYHTVVSVDPFTGDGLIDLLPVGVNKAFALEWLAEELGLDNESIVFCGDSGNDLAALIAGFRAVLVGNASESLRARVREAHRKAAFEGLLYCASGQSTCGVLEGARHYGLFL